MVKKMTKQLQEAIDLRAYWSSRLPQAKTRKLRKYIKERLQWADRYIAMYRQ